MLTDKDTWRQKPHTRLVHAVWHGAALVMERAVQQLADLGENRHALQLAHYAEAVSDAAARHLDSLAETSPTNGHDKITIAGVDSAHLNPARESTEPANGHGTNAACNSAANGIGATCAGTGLSADSHLPTGQPRTTATVAEVESELDALASLASVFANDPQAYEVALKFMGEAHSLACRGLGEAALRKLLAAKNVLRGGGEV